MSMAGGVPEDTRARLVRVAREIVVERGYGGLSTAEVIERSGVSRGGLYHHFAGKDELVAAVLETIEIELMERLAVVVADAPSPLAAIERGSAWYFEECLRSRELQRIGLVEGRKALDWSRWRTTISPYGISMFAQTLAAGMEEGEIAKADPEVLAYLLLAAMHEATAIVLAAEDRAGESGRALGALAVLIAGLRGVPPPGVEPTA